MLNKSQGSQINQKYFLNNGSGIPNKTGVWAQQRNEEGASAEQRVGALKGTSTKPSVRGLK